MSFRFLFVFAAAFFALLTGRAAETPPLILISLDGFRWDYCALHPAETPNLRRLISEGVTAQGLIPVFPTNTFPNHYSIVTGLYPSHHGIINNLCFDPRLGELFRYNRSASSRDNRWWGGEPIWTTAVKQGKVSACYFWPGSEAERDGVRPSIWKPYNYDAVTYEARLEEVVGWLKRPAEKRPAIITFYLEETNAAGHTYGPDSSQTAAAIKLLDGRVGAMAARFAKENIAANFVIVSDHGMTPCDVDRVIVLDDYLDNGNYQLDWDETSAGLRPLKGMTNATLLAAFAKLPPAQGKAYLAADLPARFHVDPANPRVPPVWIIPAEGWQVMRRSLYNTAKANFLKGQHGYDNSFTSMRGIFIASGPSFKSGVVIEPVENVHIYNLMCAATGLKPAANDGDDRLVKAALK